jgi:hypothetical protein
VCFSIAARAALVASFTYILSHTLIIWSDCAEKDHSHASSSWLRSNHKVV